MNKKSLGTVILTIYVTVVTIGCALFGCLYFLNLKDSGVNPLTRFQAQALVNQVYSERGIGGTKISALSMDYENYPNDKINDNVANIAGMHDALILASKCVLDNNQVVLNKWYFSEDGTGLWTNNNALRCSIENQSVILEFCANADYEEGGTYPHTQSIIVTKTGENSWKSEYYARVLTGWEGNYNVCVIMRVVYESDGTNIYRLTYDALNSPAETGVITETFKNVSELTGYTIGYYDCNTKTHKVLDRLTDETKMALLTDNEKLSIANSLISDMNSRFKVRKIADFGEYLTDMPANVFKPVDDYMASLYE